MSTDSSRKDAFNGISMQKYDFGDEDLGSSEIYNPF